MDKITASIKVIYIKNNLIIMIELGNKCTVLEVKLDYSLTVKSVCGKSSITWTGVCNARVSNQIKCIFSSRK